ncbi:calcium-binding protein [Aeromicrobium sp. UC242_57]|uniref:calcium-binding protein n=1 Tax=Aeromicrobium sp. UC242_57 TaxID=3374624 RepID=UPI0037A91E26
MWGATQSFQALSQTSCDGKPVTVSTALGQLPTEGDDVILGTTGNDTIQALGGNDTICTLGGNDTVDGGAGNDWVDAGAGHDVIVPRDGNDVSIGGSGIDTISYVGHPAGVTFALGFGLDLMAQNTGGAGHDAEHGVENLTGTSFADTLRGWNGPQPSRRRGRQRRPDRQRGRRSADPRPGK